MGKSRAVLYLEYLALSFVSGKSLTMDVTHQDATKQSLSYGLKFNGMNIADMTAHRWYALNDNVMGGISTGNVTRDENGFMRFFGKLSKENRGGFASCRTELTPGVLANTAGLTLKVLGDGREYSALVTPFQQDSGVNYQFKFLTLADQWQVITVPYEQMFMSIRGFRPPVYPKITGDQIHKVGLLIADKNDKDKFSLTVEQIIAYENKQI